jgi:hypothetical protein
MKGRHVLEDPAAAFWVMLNDASLPTDMLITLGAVRSRDEQSDQANTAQLAALTQRSMVELYHPHRCLLFNDFPKWSS